MPPLTISDAARVCGVSRVTLHRYIKAGKLRQRPDGTVDPQELTRAGFSLQLETVSERDTNGLPITPPVTPVTLPPEPDYRAKYIALLEQDVDRLNQELAALKEQTRRREDEDRQRQQLLQEYETQVFQLLQEQHRLLQSGQHVPQRRLPASDPHARRRQILALLAGHADGLHHTVLGQQLGVAGDLGPTLRAMVRDGLVQRVRPGVYAGAKGHC